MAKVSRYFTKGYALCHVRVCVVPQKYCVILRYFRVIELPYQELLLFTTRTKLLFKMQHVTVYQTTKYNKTGIEKMSLVA